MYKYTLFILVIFLPITTHLTWAKTKTYSENLAIHRMQFFAPTIDTAPSSVQNIKIKKNTSLATTHDITQQLHNLLVDLKSYYAMNETITGYTIQVYAGGSREQAFKVRNILYTQNPAWDPEIQYKQPHFTVRIGRFLDRLEAYKWYIPIKKLIPQAIIRPAHFPNEPHLFKINNHIDNKHSIILNEAMPNTDNPKERSED